MKLCLIAVVLIAGCGEVIHGPPLPPFPPNNTQGDGADDACARADRRLRELQCDAARGSKRGKTFTQVCREANDSGPLINAECLATVHDCTEVDSRCR